MLLGSRRRADEVSLLTLEKRQDEGDRPGVRRFMILALEYGESEEGNDRTCQFRSCLESPAEARRAKDFLTSRHAKGGITCSATLGRERLALSTSSPATDTAHVDLLLDFILTSAPLLLLLSSFEDDVSTCCVGPQDFRIECAEAWLFDHPLPYQLQSPPSSFRPISPPPYSLPSVASKLVTFLIASCEVLLSLRPSSARMSSTT